MHERGYRYDDSQTSLHIASALSVEMVELLLEYGANVNAINQFIDNVHLKDVKSPTDEPRDERFISSIQCVPTKQTPLHIAIRANRIDIVLTLLAHGADPNILRTRVLEEEQQEQQSCLDLCESEEMKSVFTHGWSPKIHKHYPKSKKDIVMQVLLVAKRNSWKLSNDILYIICNKAI